MTVAREDVEWTTAPCLEAKLSNTRAPEHCANEQSERELQRQEEDPGWDAKLAERTAQWEQRWMDPQKRTPGMRSLLGPGA